MVEDHFPQVRWLIERLRLPSTYIEQLGRTLVGLRDRCVLVRSDQEPVVVNLDIEPAEHPEEVRWIDPNHPHG